MAGRIKSVRLADGSYLWRVTNLVDQQKNPTAVHVIETFERTGDGAMVLWLRALWSGEIAGEVDARHVIIDYELPATGKPF